MRGSRTDKRNWLAAPWFSKPLVAHRPVSSSLNPWIGSTFMARKEAREIKDVWIDYKKNQTQALRNILMENYLHLVRYNAERIHAKLPDEVELDDLMSAGIFGLMDAIAAFDLERG